VLDDLRGTRIWLYIISAFCVLFLLATGYSRVAVAAQIVSAVLVIPPLLVMVSIARNIRRHEHGDEPALLAVVRGLRVLWIVLTLTSALPIAGLVLLFAYRILRAG
jgi:hypothetical protein